VFSHKKTFVPSDNNNVVSEHRGNLTFCTHFLFLIPLWHEIIAVVKWEWLLESKEMWHCKLFVKVNIMC